MQTIQMDILVTNPCRSGVMTLVGNGGPVRAPENSHSVRWTGSGTLRKASQIIMARDQGDFDLIDRKVFNYLLHRSYPDLRPGESVIHRVPVAEVLEFLGHSSTDRLNECLSRLGSLEMVIDYVDEENVPNSARTHYLSYNLEKSPDGWIEFAFDAMLLKFLHCPAVFARLSISHIRQFKSAYAAKLYEIMSLYVNRHHKVWEPSVEEFRASMSVTEGYQRFDNLRKRIVETAVEEVNAIAPFNIDIDYMRAGIGGKVSAIRFAVLPKGPKTLLDLSVTRGTSRRNQRRDNNTPDLIDGLTDEQRLSRDVTPEAIARAVILLPEGDDVEGQVEAWRASVRGRKVRDPDRSFLNWLDIQIARKGQEGMRGIDDDTISMILEGWERG